MIVFGHRGAAGEAPENTIPGFAHAVDVGVKAFEFDVRLTADDELVVFHDDSLQRTTGVDGRIEDKSLAELKTLDARHHRPDWPTVCPIPTLAEVLEAFPSLDAYQIEIKKAEVDKLPLICGLLDQAIRTAGVWDRVEVSSFQPEAISAMRAVGQARLALIGAFDSPAWVERAVALGCTGVCPKHTTATRAVIDSAHQHRLAITGWPGHTEADLAKLWTWQPTAITTDFPAVALAFVDRMTGRP